MRISRILTVCQALCWSWKKKILSPGFCPVHGSHSGTQPDGGSKLARCLHYYLTKKVA